MHLILKKTFVVVILLFSGIVCGSILMYFFSPQSVLPKNFDATHVSSIIVSVFQPWIDKTLSKKVEDTTGITTVVDAVQQLRYSRGNRHSDILAGTWSISIEFSMNDGTSFPVSVSVLGPEDTVEVLFSDGKTYYGTWPNIQTFWDSLNYPVQNG